MSGYILCQVRQAKNPYYIANISTNIYSIEELCYYFYHNIYLLDETIINEELLVWIKDELHLRRLYQRLYTVLDEEKSIGEFILPVFKEINYLSHDEFRHLNERLKRFEDQPQIVRRKIKGDYLIDHKKYRNAILVYRETLKASEGTHMGDQFTGSIYNNMGCAYASMFQMKEALECFEKAYQKLHTKASCKSLLYAVYMNDGHEAFEKQCAKYKVDVETKKEMDRQIAEAMQVELPADLDEALAAWTREYHKNTGL